MLSKPGIAATLIILSSTALASPSSSRAPKLSANTEARVTGRVLTIDSKTRDITISLEQVRLQDGTEVFLTQHPNKSITVPKTSRVHFQNNQDRWLSIAEIKKDWPIAAIVKATDDQGDSWSASQITITAPDPIRPAEAPNPFEVTNIATDRVTDNPITVPMIFPIIGKVRWDDTFLASRGGGKRRHRGQDLMAPKMTPLVATFDGVAKIETGQGNAGNVVTIVGDNGWTTQYYHVNNDNPGTDDGKGTADYAFAPGITSGVRVYAGQLIGWVGDSGNAESTSPHLHFELWHTATKACFNPVLSLRNAIKLDSPTLYLPFPDLIADRQDMRLDGIIRHIDKDRNVLVLDLIAHQKQNQPPTPSTTPNRRYIKVDPKQGFTQIGKNEALKINDLNQGSRVTLFTTDAPAGSAHTCNEAWIISNDPPTPSTPITNPDNKAITAALQSPELQKLAEALLTPLNEFRASKKLPPLQPNQTLSRTALDHSLAMMDGDWFDILDPNARISAGEKAERKGYKGSVRAVIASNKTIESLAKDLIATYADVLSSPNLIFVGIGHAYLDFDPGQTNKNNYWTVLLGE